MAIRWDWNNKVGEATFISYDGKEYMTNLYQGNAFLIFLNEWEESGEEHYSLWSFFADKEHAKNCLGLGKGSKENLFASEGTRLVKIRINKAKYQYTKDLVTLLARAFDNLTIEIYSDKED